MQTPSAVRRDRHPSPTPPPSSSRMARWRRRSGPLARLGAGLALGAGLLVAAAPGRAAAQDGPAVGIEKTTNGVDADAAPGPVVDPGAPVTWTWTVAAVGSTSLFDLVVTDSSGVVPDCDVTGDGQPDGTNVHPGPLDPGQSFTCSATGGADHDPTAGPYAAVGRVQASDFAATGAFSAEDPSHHSVATPFSPDPGVTIQTLVNGQVGQDTDGPLVTEGERISWSYVVTNTGNVPLTGIEVADDRGLAVDCGDGAAIIAGPLAPGASVTCSASARAADRAAGPQTQVGSVVAAAIDPTTGVQLTELRASDPSTYVPVELPGRLAFTGPTDLVLPIGLALTALGALLLGLANRAGRVTTGRDEDVSPTI